MEREIGASERGSVFDTLEQSLDEPFADQVDPRLYDSAKIDPISSSHIDYREAEDHFLLRGELHRPTIHKYLNAFLPYSDDPQIRETYKYEIAEYRHIFEGMLANACDRGLATPRVFGDGIHEEHEEAEPVSMLRRVGFIAATRNKIFNEDYKGALIRLDIKDFGDANQNEDTSENGDKKNSYADVLINRIAASLQKAVDDVHIDTGILPVVARYAGDEFILEIEDETLMDQLKTAVMREVTGLTGKYQRQDGSVQEAHVAFKNDTIEDIRIPEDPEDREIFQHYYTVGLILSSEEIDRVKHFRDENPLFEYVKAADIYKSDEELELEAHTGEYHEFTAQEKIERLLDIYRAKPTSIENLVDIAQTADTVIPGGIHAQELAISIIENFEVDPLLGGVIIQFDEFYDRLRSGEFVSIGMIKSVLKEPNDEFGMVVGDMVLKAASDKLWEVLGEDKNKFVISRRGSELIMGLKEGTHISSNFQEALAHMNLDYVDFHGVKMPIGFAFRPSLLPNDQDENETHRRWIDTALDKLFRAADRSFYANLYNQIFWGPENEMVAIEGVEPKEKLSEAGIIYLLLNRKRMKQRWDRLCESRGKGVHKKDTRYREFRDKLLARRDQLFPNIDTATDPDLADGDSLIDLLASSGIVYTEEYGNAT